MEIDFHNEDGIGVGAVEGDLTAATAAAFREQFQNWRKAQQEVKEYVLDLKGVSFMDSAGLGALMAMLKSVTERGGDLKIAGLQKKPRMVFEITRAYKVFEIFDDVQEAVRACR